VRSKKPEAMSRIIHVRAVTVPVKVRDAYPIGLITCFFTDVFIVWIVKPDRQRIAGLVVKYFHFGHIAAIPSAGKIPVNIPPMQAARKFESVAMRGDP